MMKFSPRLTTYSARKNNGAALAAALILLVSLTLVAVTMAYRASMDELMAANQRDALNAMSIADSGIEAGFAEVKTNYSELPQGLCDIADSGGYLVGGGPVSISGGNYAVTVSDCVAGDRAVLNSVGNVNGAVREAELLLEMTSGGGGNWPSFLANDYIEISGARFIGPLIHVHSNGRIKVSGAPLTCTSAAACGVEADPPDGLISSSAVDGFDPKSEEIETKNPYPWDLWGQVPEALTPERQELYLNNEDPSLGPPAPIDIPHVYPPDWQSNATVELTHDCRVVEGQASSNPGNEIWDVPSQGVWNGWSCTGSAWEMKSASANLYSAFYYVHGNIKISASQAEAWTATFVTAGNIEIGCCMHFNPYGQTGDAIADNIFLLAGNDIAVFGSPGQVTEGVIAAHGQVKLSGSGSHWKGAVLAEDYAHNPVPGEYYQEVRTDVQTIKDAHSINLINSNVNVEGTGIGLTGGGAPQLVVAGWRELTH